MPYDLVTDEHMRERLAAGEAWVVAATPAEIVQYNGDRWTRSGDMWVLDKSVRSRVGLAILDPVGPAGTDPGADVDAGDADTLETAEPTDAEGGDVARRGHRQRLVLRALTGAACLAVVGAGALALPVIRDHGQGAASSQAETGAPSSLPGSGAGAADGSEGTGPSLGDPPLPIQPPRDADAANPKVRPGIDASPVGGPPSAPGQNVPVGPAGPPPRQAPPVQPGLPVVPPPASPGPPALLPVQQPATPQQAAAELEDAVNRLRQTGDLSGSGRATLLERVHRIQSAVAQGKPGSKKGSNHLRKEIDRLLRDIDDLRKRGELTVQGEHVLEDAVDRLNHTL